MKNRALVLGLGGIIGANTLSGCGPAIQYAATQHPDPRMAIAGAILGATMHDYEVADYGRRPSGQDSRPSSNLIFLCESVDATRDGDPSSLSIEDITGEKRDDPAVFFHGQPLSILAGFINPSTPPQKHTGWFKNSDGTNYFASDRQDSVCSVTIYDSNGNKIYSDSKTFSGNGAIANYWNFDSSDFSSGSYSVVGTIDGNMVSRRAFEIVSR